ncbi:MAG: HAMP domain-containing histidine kinase [Deltaproteobacteria bacterium]|nr:HAMP domain-containing histidine kinase [Deltaproteobacteria bacterium]
METILDNERFVKRAFWLIKLRWMTAFLLFGIAYVISKLFDSTSQDIPLYVIGVILLLYNLLLYLALRYLVRFHDRTLGRAINRIIILQITADLLILTGVIYYSGGVENPFFFYYIFHVIISSMLLSRRMSYFQATLAVFLFGLLLTLEYFQIIRHHPIIGFLDVSLFENRYYVLGAFVVFSTTLYLVVYMTTSIISQLRKQQSGYQLLNLELGKKDRIKNEYLLSVSHDIKSHIAAIKSCLDILSTHMVGPLNEKQTELIERADHRAFKSIAFLSTLLKLTQMRLTGKIEKEPFSLKLCIYDTFAALEEKAKAKEIAIDYEISVKNDTVLGSPLLIEEALRNLLLNAIKYTPENGTVSLSVTEDNTFFIIQITDTGIGIPNDEKDKIFDEFYRARNARKVEKDGTGLGLSISKEVVQRHGGTIWVASHEGAGSTFRFTLPKYKDA